MRRYLAAGKGDGGRPAAPWDGPDAVGPGGRRRSDRATVGRPIPKRPEGERRGAPAPKKPPPPPVESGTYLALAGEGPPLSREQSESFWSLPEVEPVPPRHGGTAQHPPIDHSLSGEGDEFDPATGWTFSGLESDPLLAPVDPADDAPRPLATEDELFGPEATGSHGAVGAARTSQAAPPVQAAPRREPAPAPRPPPRARPTQAPRPAPAPKPRARGLEIPTHSGAKSPLSEAAAQMKESVALSVEFEIEDDDDLVTDGHAAVQPPAPPPQAAAPETPLGDDVDALLARGRELLSHGQDIKAVLLLRRAQRLQPGNTAVQTWRELGERRLLGTYCGAVKPTQSPRLTGHRLDFWEESSELERQLLVAIDGKRTIGRLLAAAPDDKLKFLLEMLKRFTERGWITWSS